MRKEHKVTKTHEWTETTLQICDLCGKEAKVPGSKWGAGYYETDGTVVEVRHEAGTSYPDGGGSIREIGFDVCPDCFVRVLVPFMESKGAKPTVTEHES
jgi:hypothetical protein